MHHRLESCGVYYPKGFFDQVFQLRVMTPDLIATRGAASAGVLVVQMIAIIVAFVSFVALLDALVEFLAQLVGLDGWSFEWILGKIFMPVSYVMGVEWQECEKVGQLVGIKTVINEFVAYKRLSDVKDQLRYGIDGVTNSIISSLHFLGVNHQLSVLSFLDNVS